MVATVRLTLPGAVPLPGPRSRVDRLGVGAAQRDGAIHFAFPIVVIAGAKRSAPE